MSFYKRTTTDLVSIEIVLMTLAVGVSVIWPGLLIVIPVLALFFLLARWFASGKPGLRTPADRGIGLLFLMLPVTMWASPIPDETRLQVLRLVSGIALYYSLVNWCSSTFRLRMIMPAYALGGLFLALIAPVSVQWSANKLSIIPGAVFAHFPALLSDVIHPNVLAGVLVVILPVVCGLILFSWPDLSVFERSVSSLSTAAMLAVLLLTFSRGSWIALGTVILILPLLRWRRGWILMVIAGIVLAAIIPVFGLENLVRFLSATSTIEGLDGRLEIWSRALYMVRDFPFTGIGMGAFGTMADQMYPLELFEPGTTPHAHNLFLQIAVDLGIPGLIGWLLVYFSIWKSAWKLFQYGRVHPDRLAAGLGAGVLGSQAALTTHGLLDAVTWGMVRPAPVIWAVWGLAMSAWLVLAKPKIINDPLIDVNS